MRHIKRSSLIHLINRYIKLFGYQLIDSDRYPFGYIDANQVIKNARSQRITVLEYVERIWGEEGNTERVIAEMAKSACLDRADHILEIGPGTGRYLDLIFRRLTPNIYEIYEIAHDWADWLQKTYPIVRQAADGYSLKHTPNKVCNLVHAHGVFVTLNLLHTFEYFMEMMRVCADGGFVVFNFYTEDYFDLNSIQHWLQFRERYPVVLPKETVKSFFTSRGFELMHQFIHPHGHGNSLYFIFRSNQGADESIYSQEEKL